MEGGYCFDDEREIQGKVGNDPFKMKNNPKCVFVAGALIVGAGPSGLAAAACLRERNIPSLVLERSSCIASLWQLRTYERLRLHLPKQFCELPMMPFPSSFPTYPDKHQFLSYLHAYARRFRIAPLFNQAVSAARYDPSLSLWRVHTKDTLYVSRWLVVATGENADPVLPAIPGRDLFAGPIRHTSSYKTGHDFAGKKVLVVGCGNSGMEVCLDLCNYNAKPSLVVRDTVHILPREMVGRSTFGWSMWLLKWLPIWVVDWLLLVMAWLVFGDTGRLGLERPQLGPLQLKKTSGKTPVLDVGTLAKIKTGHIKICPGIKCLQPHSVEFTNGKSERFDAIILATGYKSNVPSWLKENDMFSEVDGFPRKSFPEGWKGEYGLYAVGFTKRGLLGASMDATRIAQDIETNWREEQKRPSTFATGLS